MSAIFHHGDEQKRLALETRDRHAHRISEEIHTEITPAKAFYLAEDYHQKYRLRGTKEIMAEFDAMYPDSGDFVASTAAARVNGYLGGGSLEDLKAEIDGFGLTPEGRRALLRRVETRRH